MGRPQRAADGGLVYHVLNRANARMGIFEDDADFEAFESVLEQAVERYGTDILAWCLMPNHWHLVVRPHADGELSRFVGWLTLTHTQRWHAHRHSTGAGHLGGEKVSGTFFLTKKQWDTLKKHLHREGDDITHGH